jgi:potassium efflux system protein
MIPNTSLISLPIKTYSTESIIKMTVRIGVSYDSDIAMVEQVMMTAVKTIPFLAQPDKTALYLAQFGANSIDFDVHYYLDPLATYQA